MHYENLILNFYLLRHKTNNSNKYETIFFGFMKEKLWKIYI